MAGFGQQTGYCQGLGGLLPRQGAAQYGGLDRCFGEGGGFLTKARYSTLSGGFQVALEVKNLPANAGDVGLIPGLGRCPGDWQPTPVFLPGKSHGQNLVGYSPWGPKSWTRLSSAQVPTQEEGGVRVRSVEMFAAHLSEWHSGLSVSGNKWVTISANFRPK